MEACEITNNKVGEIPKSVIRKKKVNVELIGLKGVEQLKEGDTLHRVSDDLYFTLRGHHIDSEDHSAKRAKYFEFDGFQVNQKVMLRMFETEDFSNMTKAKRLKVYKYL